MFEALYEQRVEVQQMPDVNLITNPNAQVDLTNVTATNATVARETPAAFNPDYNTAIKLTGSASNASWMNIGGDTGAIRLGLEKGKTYTVRASARLGGTLAGTAGTFRREIVAYTRIGAGAYVTTQSARMTNAAGTADLSVTFTVPSNASEAFVRFFHGHPEAGASIWWYKIRLSEGTDTDFFDGESTTGPYFTDTEAGWDTRPGISSSWRVNRAENVALHDAEITLSYDTRRIPFTTATIVAPKPDEATLELLDPRRSRSPILNYSVTHYGRGFAGAALDTYQSSAPVGHSADIAGKLWVRAIVIDDRAGVIRIQASSGEVILEDKSNMAGGPFDTNAADVDDLTDFSIEDAGGRVTYMDPAASATALPDGPRQLWQPGASTSALYEGELAALGLRVYGEETGYFEVRSFDRPPTYNAIHSALEDGPDGTILEFTRTWDRDDWRDATLVKSDYEDGAGDRQVDYQWYPSTGANRKGEVTTIGRAIPSSSYAQKITESMQRRSERFRVRANLDFTHKPGRSIDADIAGMTFELFPQVITYRPGEGVMDIEGYRIV